MAVKKATTEKKPAAKATKTAAKAEKTTKVAKAASEKAHKATKAAKRVDETYFYAVGRRKTSVAQVRLFQDDKATDTDLIINDKKFKDYFPTIALQNNFLSPLKSTGTYGKFRMTVLVRGGGVTGQVEATRLGIARALVKFDDKLKKSLKDLGFMTRDAREVERKKAGLKKARKSPQWAKR